MRKKTASILLSALIAVSLGRAAHGRGAICGDVDGNGKVTDADAISVNRFAAGLDQQLSTTGCNAAGILQCGDLDQDGG